MCNRPRRCSEAEARSWVPACMMPLLIQVVAPAMRRHPAHYPTWFLNTPVMAPCCSGETQSWPSDHKLSCRSSVTLAWFTDDSSFMGRS